MIHDTVFVFTFALMAVILVAFILVVVNAGKTVTDPAPAQTKANSIRRGLFWVLLIVGVAVSILSTRELPYAATRGDVPDNVVTVSVEGHQWFWQLSSNEVQAGDTVVFNVTTVDVNHGLGVYDPQLRLIGQTQAMPGYTNSLELTFDEPGTYKLMCLEYCGLAHHIMISDFNVTPHPADGS